MGRAALSVLAVMALAGCKPATQAAPVDPRAEPPSRTARIAAAAPFVNTEYGVSAVFPAGARVCEALSGEHPHGFYARLGDDRMTCLPSSDPPKVSSMVIWTDSNAGFQDAEEAADPTCPDRTVETPDGRPLAFPGYGSVVCETRHGEDVQISVRTFVGTRVNDMAGADGKATEVVPHLLHAAYLNTTVEREAADVATFQRFLDGVVIGAPETALDEPACVWTRGTLAAANGTPSFRVRLDGRRGLTGVTSFNGSEAPDVLPVNAHAALESRGDVFGTMVSGEWKVCDLTSRPGAMPLARIAEARDLTASPR